MTGSAAFAIADSAIQRQPDAAAEQAPRRLRPVRSPAP